MTKTSLVRLACLRCAHSWWPRNLKPPKVCPKCKSPYWAIPRKPKKEAGPS